MTTKFKVGDRVKCVKEWYGWLDLGEEYILERAWRNGQVGIIGGPDKKLGAFEPEYFELIPQFKVGELIRCIRPADGLTVGFLYEVLSHDPEGDPYIENDEGDSKPYSSSHFQNSELPYESAFDPKPEESIADAVTRRTDYASLCYQYLNAKNDFEAASTSFNEACQEFRSKVPVGTKFVYNRGYSDSYIVTRDEDGFEFEKVETI